MEGPGGGGGGGTQPVLTLDHHHTGWSPTGTRHVHGHAHGYDTSMGTSSAVGDEWVSIESMDVDDMPPGDMRSMPEYDVEHRVHDAYGHGHGYGREMPSHLGHGQGKEKERKGRNFMETFSPERLRYSVQADKENASGGNLRHSGRGLGLSADGRAVLARANTSRVGRELRNTMYEEEQQGGFAGAGTGKRGETGVAKPRSRGRAHTDYDPHHAKRGAPYDHARTHTTHGGGQPPTPSIGGNVPTPMSPPGTSSSTRDGAGSGLLGAPVGEVRGWFASLFHWRSHSFTLGSIGSPLATRVEAIRVLHTLGADVRPDAHSDALSATGILRCAVGDVRFRAEVIERGGPGNETPSAASTTYYTPSGGIAYAPTPMPVPTPMPTPNANYSMSTTPLIAQSPTHATYTPGPTPTPSLNASAAAFTPALGQRAGASLAKVLADDTHMCALVLVHEKGPVSGFRTVCKRLREEWTLAPHNYGHGVSSPEASAGSQRVSVVSPTFSPGGGFAEQQGAARRVLV
ncbi:hypothetical protein CONPUDRAFT_83800 [Coniophora puteana RWD-64-598 SS2]|uniref:Uncharacterized protein n=1 Tax=Coniophora puteana (strain RWD-64-598) TaxID=741705 RepID=A0A5M3MGK1_CONPW|nr:uncharacterized protein CONPUDRAFT_83800 [Coniophora puteana RWD-64-598 SS2]EIW78368.1 hypothetical protein CONPUDRAFT_83800 [Coniophora puteana RWD-64-598 SS2]